MSRLLVSQLGVVCPSCDALSAPGAQRCEACGKTWGRAPAPARKPTGSTPAVSPPASPPPPAARPPAPASGAGLRSAPTPAGGVPRTGPAPRPAAPAPVPSRYILSVTAGPARGQRFRLMANGCSVGRQRGAILFADDAFVSPHHAAFRIREGQLTVKDEESVSGVYVAITTHEMLVPGALFSVGPHVLRYVGPLLPRAAEAGKPRLYGAPVPQAGGLWGLEEILIGLRPGRAVVTAQPTLTLGSSGADLVFAPDPQLAARHCEISPAPQGAVLRDLSGGLGTFVRLGAQERPLKQGDRVRIGQQTLTVELAA
jgi:pSer/pThr/pTyr-binding forkhead associated (FHA) protein